MNTLRIAAIATTLVLGAMSNVSVSQETQNPAAAPAASPVPAPDAKSAPPSVPKAASPASTDDGEFVPSEEISADEEVTFPVDI
jgi:hypothetical protein